MGQRLRIGNVVLEVSANSLTELSETPTNRELKAEKPDMPEPLEETAYIYRPNDPFRAQIDEARAIGSISATHKPWVKRSWFVLFIIGPLVYAELSALAESLNDETGQPWMWFLGRNLLILPIWFLLYSIWRNRVRGSSKAQREEK